MLKRKMVSTTKQELSYNLANTLYQQKKYAEAIKEYEKAASRWRIKTKRKYLLQ